ncbi:MAG: hypothetical protein JXB06_15025 [Spirochaetales bacterium]|nr:hypothetical protein [Spirochaetales bacterium]
MSQRELDAPAAGALSDIPAAAESKSPESVPLSWREAGRSPPEEEQKAAAGEQKTDDAGRHRELLAALSDIDDGIEAPGHLFAVAKEKLGLKRAALLLYDPVRMVFAPWAVYGFDETTNHRLRIPLGSSEHMNRLASGKVAMLSGQQALQPFQQYFSFRGFSTLEHLVLVPFIHESRFMGLLLIADMEAKTEAEEMRFFETLADRAAGVLYNARERHLQGAARVLPEQPESIRQGVRSALQPVLEQGISPLMIRIDTAGLIESVKRQNPYIDPFRLSQDIRRVVLSLFQSLGSVFQVDRDRLLILVTRRTDRNTAEDPGLLIHHLRATLIRLLPELSERASIDLDEQVRIPRPDMEEVLILLAEIV